MVFVAAQKSLVSATSRRPEPPVLSNELKLGQSTPLYQKCLSLRKRLIRMRGLTLYFALLPTFQPTDPIMQLWDLFSTGISLCFIFDQLSGFPKINHSTYDLELYHENPYREKKRAIALFLAQVRSIQFRQAIFECELFTVSDVWRRDSTDGLIKVIDVVTAIVDRLPASAFWYSPPISTDDSINRAVDALELTRHSLVHKMVETERNSVPNTSQDRLSDHDELYTSLMALAVSFDADAPFPAADKLEGQGGQDLLKGQSTPLTKRQHALHELLSSERAYASDLALMRQVHIPLALGQQIPHSLPISPPSSSGSSPHTVSTASSSSLPSLDKPNNPSPDALSSGPAPMIPEDVKIIFNNITEIAAFSDLFCLALQEALGDLLQGGKGDDHVGALFLSIIPELEKPYKHYITRHPTSLTHLSSLPPTPALQSYLLHTQSIAFSLSHTWDLPSLLIKPVQRLLKYPLLLTAIIDETPDSHTDYHNLEEARKQLEEVARKVDEGRQGADVVRDVLTSNKKPPGPGVGVAASVNLIKMKSLRLTSGSSVGGGGGLSAAINQIGAGANGGSGSDDQTSEEAMLVARLESELKTMEEFAQRFAKHIVEWARSTSTVILSLRTWALGYSKVVGLTPDQGSEAFDVFLTVIEKQLMPLYVELEAVINERVLKELAHLLMTTTQPLKLLATMNEQELYHYHLMNMTITSKKRPPPPSLLAASTNYLFLRGQLAAELPTYITLFHRGLHTFIHRLSAIQTEFNAEVREQWLALWEMLRLEEELNTGHEGTVDVWRTRWNEVDDMLCGMPVVNDPRKVYQDLRVLAYEKRERERERELKEREVNPEADAEYDSLHHLQAFARYQSNMPDTHTRNPKYDHDRIPIHTAYSHYATPSSPNPKFSSSDQSPLTLNSFTSSTSDHQESRDNNYHQHVESSSTNSQLYDLYYNATLGDSNEKSIPTTRHGSLTSPLRAPSANGLDDNHEDHQGRSDVASTVGGLPHLPSTLSVRSSSIELESPPVKTGATTTSTSLTDERDNGCTRRELRQKPIDRITPIHLLEILAEVLRSPQKTNQLLSLKNDDAQTMIDFLHSTLLLPMSESWPRKRALIALYKLAKAAMLYPQCYVLKHITPDIRDSPEDYGGFCDIYRGRHSTEQKSYCLKAVRMRKSETDKVLKMFSKEAILWAHLHHPNILPFYGVYYLDKSQRRICLVSPWMSNGNIVRYLEANPYLPRRPFVYDIACGMGYLHRENIIHGDLKGMNVLVDDLGRACVADFGLSLVLTDKTFGFSNATSATSGASYRWLSPELLNPPCKPGRESDVWAFACVWYEVMTRQLPYYELPNDFQVFSVLLRGQLPTRPEEGLNSDLDKIDNEAWESMMQCWKTEPAARPTFLQILQELEQKGHARPEEGPNGEDLEHESIITQNTIMEKPRTSVDLFNVQKLLQELI